MVVEQIKMEQSSILAKFIGHFFFIIKIESNPSTSIFIFSAIPQILGSKFFVFWT